MSIVEGGPDEDSTSTDPCTDPVPSHTPHRPYRSRSLPHLLSRHDSGVGTSTHSGTHSSHGSNRQALASRLVADLRQLLTLKQHYYPEGGWGWVIVVVGVMVQILSHGLQSAGAVLWQEAVDKFGREVHMQAGNLLKFSNFSGVYT